MSTSQLVESIAMKLVPRSYHVVWLSPEKNMTDSYSLPNVEA